MLSTTPIALINTISEELPAEMNGSGSPVGGIEPFNISYCIIKLSTKKEQIYCYRYLSIKLLRFVLFIIS